MGGRFWPRCLVLMLLLLMPSCGTLKALLEKEPPADSYCSTYHKVLCEKGDSEFSARLSVRQRIAANEKGFRDLCGVEWEKKSCGGEK